MMLMTGNIHIWHSEWSADCEGQVRRQMQDFAKYWKTTKETLEIILQLIKKSHRRF